MEKKKLEMEFLNEGGKKFVISIDDPRDDLTGEEVGQAMADIIANNVFVSSMEDLVEAKEARIVTTTVEQLII
ncbi:MAG: DUF2922 domain-containing protein [Tissierellia bacterium]|nr:DUF2922 domain-containing protein [Tissierellia bacterium]